MIFNYPNPFNPSTEISYNLNHDSHINISIFDFIGRHIITLFNENQSVGTHIVKWDGRNNNGKQVSAGMYIYSLKSNSHVQSNKMILLR